MSAPDPDIEMVDRMVWTWGAAALARDRDDTDGVLDAFAPTESGAQGDVQLMSMAALGAYMTANVIATAAGHPEGRTPAGTEWAVHDLNPGVEDTAQSRFATALVVSALNGTPFAELAMRVEKYVGRGGQDGLVRLIELKFELLDLYLDVVKAVA